MNEYTPWIELGITETEYWRNKYLEERQINHELETDAGRWRALMSCERIRLLGTGGLGTDHQHIGLEIWDKYPKSIEVNGKATLTVFVDTIRLRVKK